MINYIQEKKKKSGFVKFFNCLRKTQHKPQFFRMHFKKWDSAVPMSSHCFPQLCTEGCMDSLYVLVIETLTEIIAIVQNYWARKNNNDVLWFPKI